MKIENSSMSLASSYQSLIRDQSSERLQVWSGRRPEVPAENREDNAAPQSAVAISKAARAALAADLKAAGEAAAKSLQQSDQSGAAAAINQAFDEAENDPVVGLLKSMIEMMTGEAIRLFSANDLRPLDGPSPPPPSPGLSPDAVADASPQALPAGAGLEYDYHSVHEEFQQVNFTAEGVIKTADGQEISFKIDLSMSRYYREETAFSVRAGDAVRKDPLVLNFDGPAAQLSDRRFEFDLLGDGKKQSLPLLQGNRGYLAIDRNGNGIIDSGKELFGPRTNAGFKELAGLDSDGNGWIDENDPVFDTLTIWKPDENGLGRFLGLRQGKVGAIGLPHVASPFDLRGNNNSDLGAIASSGLFLDENGNPGTVQEVDLTV